MKTLKKKKKILFDCFEYEIVGEKGKVVSKVFGNNINLIKEDGNLFSLKYRCQTIDKKTKEIVEYENLMLLNKNNEILFEDVTKITITVGFNYILELDGISKSWKKLKKIAKDRIFCIIDYKGVLAFGPTTKNIKFIPCIGSIVIGDQIFKTHHSQPDYGKVVELVQNNSYAVTLGTKKGIIYGQAEWRTVGQFWDHYVGILLPFKYDIVEVRSTFVTDVYIIKLNDKFSLMKVSRVLGYQNYIPKNRFKAIKEIYNNNKGIGFLCINDGGCIEFWKDVLGYYENDPNPIILETKNEKEALTLIHNLIETDYSLFDPFADSNIITAPIQP